jgi:hypothetical protein
LTPGEALAHPAPMTAETHAAHDAYEGPEMPDMDKPVAADAGRARRASILAWTVWLAAIVPTVAGLLLLASTWDAVVPYSYGFRGFTTMFALTFATLAAVILARQPSHRIGWVFAIAGVEGGIQIFVTEYATYAGLVHPGSLPGAEIAAWLTAWGWLIAVTLVGPVLLLLFPDGRLLTPRWRFVMWLAIVAAVLFGVVLAFTPGPLNNARYVDNPFGIAAVDALAPLASVGGLLLVASLVAAAGSLVLRYRRAGPTERLQLRWVAFAALVVAATGPLGFSGQKFGEIAFIFGILSIPIAAGIAVMRYRLYDIDLIINRTIVYGLLTAILAGVYAGTVALLQRVFVAVTGGGSDAAIVLSTVAVVSVFTPVRARLQRLVDRRFREVRDPRVELAEFVTTIETRIWRLEPDAVLRRLLEVAASALGASAASVAHSDTLVARVGEGSFEPAVVATSGDGSARVTVAVGPRSEGAPFAERDRAALQSAVAAVAEALTRSA